MEFRTYVPTVVQEKKQTPERSTMSDWSSLAIVITKLIISLNTSSSQDGRWNISSSSFSCCCVDCSIQENIGVFRSSRDK